MLLTDVRRWGIDRRQGNKGRENGKRIEVTCPLHQRIRERKVDFLMEKTLIFEKYNFEETITSCTEMTKYKQKE